MDGCMDALLSVVLPVVLSEGWIDGLCTSLSISTL